MKFPPSEYLGRARNPEGQSFSLHFYGEDENDAVIVGPIPMSTWLFEQVPEVHRESAKDPVDARAKLNAWVERNGWRLE